MVTFPVVEIKYTDELNLREKGFYFSPQFQVAAPHSLEAKDRSLRGADLTKSAVRKWREMDAGAQFNLSSPGMQP